MRWTRLPAALRRRFRTREGTLEGAPSASAPESQAVAPAQAGPEPVECLACQTANPQAARFCLNCGQQLGEARADTAQGRLHQYIPRELLAKLEAARAEGGMQGERRVVTMLFCDVTGSTAAASKLDPEEWAEIMNGAFQHLISPVYRYEGTLARLMGDAILAFFGAPIAHEDDPQRAVLTGLQILEGIRPYQEEAKRRWDIDFDVRVGINTGLVVVSEVGSDLRLEYTALGDAINLAARMEQTAQPGTVQVSADTYRLVAPLFEFEDLGGIQVKRKTEPVQAYGVVGYAGRLHSQSSPGARSDRLGDGGGWSRQVPANHGAAPLPGVGGSYPCRSGRGRRG